MHACVCLARNRPVGVSRYTNAASTAREAWPHALREITCCCPPCVIFGFTLSASLLVYTVATTFSRTSVCALRRRLYLNERCWLCEMVFFLSPSHNKCFALFCVLVTLPRCRFPVSLPFSCCTITLKLMTAGVCCDPRGHTANLLV